MKKLTSLLLVLFLIVSMTACGSSEPTVSEPQEPEKPSIASIIKKAELQYPASNEQFKYNVYDTYVEITEYLGDDSAKELIVPATLEDLPVYVIDHDVFNKCGVESIIFEDGIDTIHSEFSGKLKKVSLPSTLDFVGYGTFKGCYGLEEVIIPEGIDSIQAKTFEGCSSLKEITIPSTVNSINSELFAYCSKLEKINLPDGLKWIADKAFLGCEALKSIQIPNTVESIGAHAFQGTGLETIEIPESVKKVNGGLFLGCEDLTKVTVYNSEMKIEESNGSTTLLFTLCNPDLVVCGKPGSTIAKACARENVFFEVMK